METEKIKARYKNGVIEPLEKLELPEGQELEVEIKSVPSTTSGLTIEEKKALIRKLGGCMKGTWGNAEEIDAYIKSEKESWHEAL